MLPMLSTSIIKYYTDARFTEVQNMKALLTACFTRQEWCLHIGAENVLYTEGIPGAYRPFGDCLSIELLIKTCSITLEGLRLPLQMFYYRVLTFLCFSTFSFFYFLKLFVFNCMHMCVCMWVCKCAHVKAVAHVGQKRV